MRLLPIHGFKKYFHTHAFSPSLSLSLVFLNFYSHLTLSCIHLYFISLFLSRQVGSPRLQVFIGLGGNFRLFLKKIKVTFFTKRKKVTRDLGHDRKTVGAIQRPWVLSYYSILPRQHGQAANSSNLKTNASAITQLLIHWYIEILPTIVYWMALVSILGLHFVKRF